MYNAEFSHTAKFGYCCVANPNIKLSKATTKGGKTKCANMIML